jgi:isoamyl acetate esterase
MKAHILLIGDSIRMAYLPLVQKDLAEEAEIFMIKQNCEDSRKIKKKLKKWLKNGKKKPFDVIHFNCGLHDIKKKFNKTDLQVGIEEYQQNLKGIIKILKSRTKAKLVWATTTPVIYERHHEVKGFDRVEEDVKRYNAVAVEIMKNAKIPINDLNQVITSNSIPECILPDGVHMTEKGNRALADAVVKTLLEYLD